MTFAVTSSPQFVRKVAKFLKKHPDLRSDVSRIVTTLSRDPYQPSLRLHPLKGQLEGLHAVSLTYEYRIVLILRVEETTITLVNIGSHDEVYGKGD